MFIFNNKKFKSLENIELETDRSGRVHTQDDYFQIKVWLYKNEISNLVGTITFHLNMNDIEYNGVFNKSNSRKILDIWFFTGISNYILECNGKEWILKYNFRSYFGHPEYGIRIKDFLMEYPEYKILML
jgi:hypothetical protein